MDKEELKNRIEKAVIDLQGCKATELMVHLAPDLQEASLILPNLIPEMVAEGRLVEVEYTLPAMPYRVKSFFLPKGAEVRLI